MRHARIPVLLLLVFLVAGCATTTNVNGKNFIDMTPKERAVFFQEFYNKQYDDAASMGALASQGKLTDGQVTVYRNKKAVLTQVKPLILAYRAIVDGGGIPNPNDERAILDLVNQLATMSAGGAR